MSLSQSEQAAACSQIIGSESEVVGLAPQPLVLPDSPPQNIGRNPRVSHGRLGTFTGIPASFRGILQRISGSGSDPEFLEPC